MCKNNFEIDLEICIYRGSRNSLVRSLGTAISKFDFQFWIRSADSDKIFQAWQVVTSCNFAKPWNNDASAAEYFLRFDSFFVVVAFKRSRRSHSSASGYSSSVWPNDGIKSCLISSQKCPKSCHTRFPPFLKWGNPGLFLFIFLISTWHKSI